MNYSIDWDGPGERDDPIEKMPERAYTVAEIDRMRDAIYRRLQPEYERRRFVRDPITGHVVQHGWIMDPVPPAVVEERLRTYMLAGISPEDLEG